MSCILQSSNQELDSYLRQGIEKGKEERAGDTIESVHNPSDQSRDVKR